MHELHRGFLCPPLPRSVAPNVSIRHFGRRGPQLSHSQPLAVLPVLPQVGTRIPLTRWLSVICLPVERDDSGAT